MKSKIIVLCCCVLLCISSTFSTPVGEKPKKDDIAVKTVEEAGTTASPLFVRQEEGGSEGPAPTGSVPDQTSATPDVVVDEESDEDEEEERTEAPKVAAGSSPNVTTTRKPLKTSSFNNEWAIVTGQRPQGQGQVPPQPQAQVEGQAPSQPAQQEQGVEKETDTDASANANVNVETDSGDKDNEADNDNDADTQADDQDNEDGEATKNKGDAQEAESPDDEEDEDVPSPTEKAPVKIPVSTSTPSSSVAEEWAVVTGNQTALKVIQDSKKVKTSKPEQEDDVSSTSTTTASTTTFTSFDKEWAIVTGNLNGSAIAPGAGVGSESVSGQGVQEQEQEQSAVVSSTTEEVATNQPESQSSSSNNAVTGTDQGEEDDEEEQAVTEQPVVSSTAPTTTTVKSVPSFNKEWAYVTGGQVPPVQEQQQQQQQEEEDTPDQLHRGGPHLSDGGQARAGCECGKVPFQVPGEGVNQWPWVAAIVRNGLFAGGRPHCGATLINNKYVLTAASCMDGLLPDRVEVWLTVHDSLKNSGSSSGTLKLGVEKILMHPNYHRSSGDNDIALIGLSESVPIGENNYFVPACVPAGKLDYSGIMGKMAAWGSSDVGQFNQRVNNNRLCKQDMPILSNDVCNRDTRHNGKITNNMLCAGFITPKAESNCVSDAGGGLVISNGGRHTLIGITSFGYTPNRAYSPTVHSRVSEYVDFILHNTLDAEWCS